MRSYVALPPSLPSLPAHTHQHSAHAPVSTLQAVGRTLCTPVHAQCCQQPQHPVTIAAPDASRRQLLGSVALLGAAAATASLSAAQPAQAAATCELTSSPSGLQFCDTQEGTGPEPVKVCALSCGGGGMWSVFVYSQYSTSKSYLTRSTLSPSTDVSAAPSTTTACLDLPA